MKPKFALRHFLALALAGSSLLAVSSASALDGNWTSTGSGNWSDGLRWSTNPAIPGGTGSTISIASNITGARTVTIDTTSRTVGSLTIGDASHGFTIAASGGASLIFDNGLSDATLTENYDTGLDDAISAPITLNSNLAITTNAWLPLSGEISGSKSITKSGNGRLIMTVANTYTGATTVTAGLLSLENALALQSSTLDTTGSIANGLRTTVTSLTLGGLSGNKNLSSLMTGANGYSTLSALTLNPGTGVTNNYDANIGIGNGSMTLTKDGLGTQVFTVAQTYTGGTAVTNGTLLINNTTGSGTGSGAVTVGTLGTLGGSGTITGAVTVDGALKPGNSPGLLTVGSLDLNASASTTLEINGLTRGAVTDGYDALGLNLGGSIDFGGALIFEFGNGSAFANSAEFDLFSFTTTSTGDFAGVTSTGFYAGTWGKTGDIWSLTDEGQTLNFSEVTGNLTLVAIPEPRAALLGSLGVLLLFRRRRV